MGHWRGEVTVYVSTFFAANYFMNFCWFIKGHRDHGKKSQKPAGLWCLVPHKLPNMETTKKMGIWHANMSNLNVNREKIIDWRQKSVFYFNKDSRRMSNAGEINRMLTGQSQLNKYEAWNRQIRIASPFAPTKDWQTCSVGACSQKSVFSFCHQIHRLIEQILATRIHSNPLASRKSLFDNDPSHPHQTSKMKFSYLILSKHFPLKVSSACAHEQIHENRFVRRKF